MKKIFKIFLIVSIFLLIYCIPCLSKGSVQQSKALEEDTQVQVKDDEVCNPGDYYWVIYDNVCPYCRQATKHIKVLDWEGRFKFLSYRNPLTYKMFPFLTIEECEKEVHMVTPKGEVLSGYEVFKTIIDNLTATKILNPLLKNDYAQKQLQEIYQRMVKERSCYYGKLESCPLKKGK